jgi:hypothetical protein
MIMKFCPNYTCAAYGRVVYTQTTRCVFCRWDLKPPRMRSEAVDEPAASEQTLPGADNATPPASRTHHKRSALRPTV